jgi:hypothetical protein
MRAQDRALIVLFRIAAAWRRPHVGGGPSHRARLWVAGTSAESGVTAED